MADEREIILDEMRRVDAMLYKNEQLFDLAVDEADIEALVYEHRALTIRQSALIQKAKKLGLKEGLMCGR